MKEKELIELGFEKFSESDWYYYTYEFNEFDGEFSLISNSSDDLVDGKWFVELFGSENIRFTNITDVITLIELIKRNTINHER